MYKKIICQDGFQMSVQASQNHYCDPRVDSAAVYSRVEVGFPSEREAMIMEYAEDPNTPIATVYGWVPYETIRAVIEKHGGMISGELPPFPE